MSVANGRNPEITAAYDNLEAISSFEQLAEQHTLGDCISGLKKLAYQRIHNPLYSKKKAALLKVVNAMIERGELSLDDVEA